MTESNVDFTTATTESFDPGVIFSKRTSRAAYMSSSWWIMNLTNFIATY